MLDTLVLEFDMGRDDVLDCDRDFAQFCFPDATASPRVTGERLVCVALDVMINRRAKSGKADDGRMQELD